MIYTSLIPFAPKLSVNEQQSMVNSYSAIECYGSELEPEVHFASEPGSMLHNQFEIDQNLSDIEYDDAGMAYLELDAKYTWSLGTKNQLEMFNIMSDYEIHMMAFLENIMRSAGNFEHVYTNDEMIHYIETQILTNIMLPQEHDEWYWHDDDHNPVDWNKFPFNCMDREKIINGYAQQIFRRIAFNGETYFIRIE